MSVLLSFVHQHFYNDINSETMELMHLILQTLIETCVGNFPNQEVIYNRQIVDVLNTILQLNIGDHHKYGYSIEDVSCFWPFCWHIRSCVCSGSPSLST